MGISLYFFYRHFVYDTFENTVPMIVSRTQLSAIVEKRERIIKNLLHFVCLAGMKARGFSTSSDVNHCWNALTQKYHVSLKERRKPRLLGLVVLMACLDFSPGYENDPLFFTSNKVLYGHKGGTRPVTGSRRSLIPHEPGGFLFSASNARHSTTS